MIRKARYVSYPILWSIFSFTKLLFELQLEEDRIQLNREHNNLDLNLKEISYKRQDITRRIGSLERAIADAKRLVQSNIIMFLKYFLLHLALRGTN
jgi:hypothetical protein